MLNVTMRVQLGNVAYDMWPITILLLLMSAALLWYRQGFSWFLPCYIIFGVYILGVLSKVFFPLMISGGFADAMRQSDNLLSVNLIPFHFGRFTFSDELPQVLLNILMTIPFGFGLPFVANVRARQFLWLGPLVGFSLEFMQLIVSLILRYAYRHVDITDVLMNMLGVWIGYAVFRLFAGMFMSVMQGFSSERRGMLGYIYAVAERTVS